MLWAVVAGVVLSECWEIITQPMSARAEAALASSVASDQEPTNWTFMVTLGQTLRAPRK